MIFRPKLDSHQGQILCSRGRFVYLPCSICSLWALILSLVVLYLLEKPLSSVLCTSFSLISEVRRRREGWNSMGRGGVTMGGVRLVTSRILIEQAICCVGYEFYYRSLETVMMLGFCSKNWSCSYLPKINQTLKRECFWKIRVGNGT